MEDLQLTPDGLAHRGGQLDDRRFDARAGLEDLSGDAFPGRVEGGTDRLRQVVREDEIARLVAVAVDGDGPPRDRRPQPCRHDALLVGRVRTVGVREPQDAGRHPVGSGVRLAVRLGRQLGRAVR